MPKHVIVTIKPDGDTQVEAFEFQGQGCKAATRELEMVLAGGASNTDTRPKPDFYATNPGSNTLTGR